MDCQSAKKPCLAHGQHVEVQKTFEGANIAHNPVFPSIFMAPPTHDLEEALQFPSWLTCQADRVFTKALTGRQIPTYEEVLLNHKPQCDITLQFKYDNVSWLGKLRRRLILRQDAILGIKDWVKFKIVLPNDGFIFLHPSQLDAQKTEEAPHSALKPIHDLPSIFAFAASWLPSTEGGVYIFITELQALAVEFYHPSGIVLAIQFELGHPEGEVNKSWGSAWGLPVAKK